MPTRREWVWAVPLFALAMPVAAADTPQPADALAAHLAALKDVKSLTAGFVCEKTLSALDTPLVSAGRVWIVKPASIRFTTEKPYTSDLILHDGKIHARSQHEKTWTHTDQKARPGLPAVMNQLAAWATGGGEEAKRLGALYDIAGAGDTTVPSRPGAKAGGDGKKADVFTLTPKDKDLAKAVKQILLAIDPDTHLLAYVQITTAQDDVTRYWFANVTLNADVPRDTFEAK